LLDISIRVVASLANLKKQSSGQVSPEVQVELRLLRLRPGFSAVPYHFNLPSVGPCPSQNRACAINAHGSSECLSHSIEEINSHSPPRQWEDLEQPFEFLPPVAPALAPPIHPLE
jgi:hypothetical protein